MNKTEKRKRISSVIMILVLLFGLIGCENKRKNDKIQLTMYLWDRPMMIELTPYLEEKFPEIDFTFVVGYNTMNYYTDLNDRGSLPDIITCRRFSLNDAALLSEELMDLSETDLVGSFYDNYIENNREPGGAIRWLPICAEVDGYIVNLDLFEKYQIPLPENEKEFADVCLRFEELGIRGYLNDYRMDYSCMEALQGSSIPKLTGLEGVVWRAKYENEADNTAVLLDDQVWPSVFENFEQYLNDTRVVPSDLEINYQYMEKSILEEKSAMMRGTAEDCLSLRAQGVNAVMLPYFGETKDDNWVLTYPAFQVAVNKAVQWDEKKAKAISQVLQAMFSEEGQKAVAAGNAVLTYNRNVDFEMNEAFSKIEDCIESNRLYMRLASTKMFSASKDVVQKMILGEYDAKRAYDAFNKQLMTDRNISSAEIFMTQNTAYEYAFGKNGSPAASSVINTIRRKSGDDIVIGYSNVISTSVFAGNYSETQLNRLLANWMEMRSGRLTGAEIHSLMEWLVNAKNDGTNPIRHKNLIPVTSGIEYFMKNNGDGTYTLEDIMIDGKDLEAEREYQISMVGDLDFLENCRYCNCPMPEALKEKMKLQDINVYSLFRNALENGNQMAEPTGYVTVR